MTTPIQTGFADWNRQSSEAQVLEINDNNITKNGNFFYPLRYVGNAKSLMTWINPLTFGMRFGLRFFGDAGGTVLMDNYALDISAGGVARQPVPILGPFMDAFVQPSGAGNYNYTFQVWRNPGPGTFAGANIEFAMFNQVFSGIGAGATTVLTSLNILEGEVTWSGNMTGGAWFIEFQAVDYNGLVTTLDHLDQGGPVLATREIWVPPATIQAKVVNQAAGAQNYILHATRQFNK